MNPGIRVNLSEKKCTIGTTQMKMWENAYPDRDYDYYECDTNGSCKKIEKPDKVDYYCEPGYGGKIKKISDDLYVGELNRKGTILYFGLEKYDYDYYEANKWSIYAKEAEVFNKMIRNLIGDLKSQGYDDDDIIDEFRESIADELFNFSTEEIKNMLDVIKVKGWHKSNHGSPFTDSGGIVGFEELFSERNYPPGIDPKKIYKDDGMYACSCRHWIVCSFS